METFSPLKTEIVWLEEECHQMMLPLKQEDCKLEDTPVSADYFQSSVEVAAESTYTSEETQFAAVKLEIDSEDEGHETAILDVKEDVIIEDENPLRSSSEEMGRLPPSAPDTQSEKTVPQSFYTRSGETYYCVPCDTPFHSLSDYNSHMSKTHKRINRFQCPKCEKNFHFESKLREHVVMHSDVKPFSCRVCNQQFARYGEMRRHTYTHYKSTSNLKSNKVPNYQQGGVNTISEQGGETHLPSVQQKDEEITIMNEHFCNHCSALFTSKGELAWHISTIHNRPEKGYKCPKCLKSFPYRSKLLEHINFLSCNWKNDCNICKRTFSRRTELFQHMQEHAPGDASMTAKVLGKRCSVKDVYPCRICGKTFPWPSHLKRHMETHTQQSVFTCDICKKAFNSKSGLLHHIEKHTAESGHSSPVRIIDFPDNADVSKHVRTSSRDQPSNTCDVCDKKFTTISSLRYHMRLHSHGKLFTCSLCGGQFFNNFALKCHLRLTHPESKLVGKSQNELSKEDAATPNGLRNESLGLGEVESNIGRDPLDTHKTRSLATTQNKVIVTHLIKERIETSSSLNADIGEVSNPFSRNEGEKSFSGEGQNLTKKDNFTSSQCNRIVNLSREKKPAEMHTNAKNCEGGNLSLPEKITNDGKIENSTGLHCGVFISGSSQERLRFSCKECGVYFSDVKSFKKHNISKHNDPSFSCNVCGMVFMEQSNLDSHMIVHTADRPYTCFICKRAFRRIRSLRSHLQCHEGQARFPCEVCDDIFDSIVALRQHLISHTEKEVQP